MDGMCPQEAQGKSCGQEENDNANKDHRFRDWEGSHGIGQVRKFL
jgi:hypothetical protein